LNSRADNLLSLCHITKAFGGLRAVEDVSLDIKRGSITGLIGPNGSGKTTLFNVISGVCPPDKGEMYFDGDELAGLQPHDVYRRGLVRTFQFPRPFYKMTLLDNMLIAARCQNGDHLSRVFLRNRWIKQEAEFTERSMETLDFFELSNYFSSLPSCLSGGQLKLLELAKVLMSDPKMILLDEPASGIAPPLAKKIFRKILELRSTRNVTFFVIEHRMEYILDFADWVFVMHKGRIIDEGQPETVMKSRKVIDAYLGEAG
jgi:ABC-type branched-subunit amino acid transport system ATPase component